MKKRSFILLFIVGLVGLFLPRDTFAEHSFETRLFMDYRFFVEDQDEKDIDTLHFKLHDVNNVFSFDSEYDPESKAYYFLGDVLNGGQEIINGERILPSNLLEDITNIDFSNVHSEEEYMNVLNSIPSKYSSVVLSNYGPGYLLYLPFVLEEVNHQGDGEPIKKTIFSEVSIFSYGNDYNRIFIGLINNSCAYANSGDYDNAPENVVNDLMKRLSFTRKSALDYDENFINQYLSLQVATSEIQNDNYLNKGFLNDKFSTGEIASGDIASSDSPGYGSRTNNIFNGKQISAVKLRNSSDNLKEELLKDYCDCLPVFVQARKAPSIVEVITNPKTFTTGVMALAVSLLLALGFVAFILTNQKKSDIV